MRWLADEKAQGKRRDEELKAKGKKPKNEPVRLADQTIRRIVAPVRSCLASARRDGLIHSNPADKVALPRRHEIQEEDEAKAKALTKEQLAMLLRIIPSKHRLFFELLSVTGLRWGEAAALRWKDLSLETAPHLRVRRALARARPAPPCGSKRRSLGTLAARFP